MWESKKMYFLINGCCVVDSDLVNIVTQLSDILKTPYSLKPVYLHVFRNWIKENLTTAAGYWYVVIPRMSYIIRRINRRKLGDPG